MRRQLRVWWPKQLPPNKLQSPPPPPPPSSYILFGWVVSSSSASLDILVALAMDEASLRHLNSSIEEILCKTNRDMPIYLQKKSLLSVVGQYVTDIHSTLPKVSEGVGKLPSSSSVAPNDGNMWIKLVNGSYGQYGKFWVPKVESIHFKGELMSQCDVHVVLYKIPRYGSHHFSLSYSDFSKQATVSLKKPQWLVKLQMQNSVVDLDTVIVALNCSAAVERYLKTDIGTKKHIWVSIASRYYVFMWHSLAIVTATLSSLFYIILQSFYCCSSADLVSWIWSSSRIFDTTWANIKVRSSQISYWPIFLLESGSRSNSCVEYAEKAALRKHSMWSNLAVDILLGNFLGWALMLHAKSLSSFVLSFGNDVSNLSRTGCVWLMGVPAGFKLNTEAAAVLGTVSLHVIQIWSTLLVLVSFFLNYIVKGLALSGMVFGASVFAALVVDLTVIASLHLATLHWLTSLVYSLQTQALAALWRLFRGQKLNPLRVRLDSYDYTVEQHIVGSLLFTPLLLLLPTTSVFYIFFTIMSSSISIICIMTEVLISLIHGTPYVKIFIWLVNPRRFPSGIWFEIGSTVESANDLVSFLHSNSPSIGDIIRPHYGEVFSQRFRSLVVASAYGALTGRRVPQRFGTRVPATTPWMAIPVKDYWLLCRESVLSCSVNGDSI